jgi:Protein of unknown function (DUF2793)
MSDTPLLVLPYIAGSQAQKHVTHNEALSLLDGLLHLSVISRSLAVPPLSPIDGDRYLISGGPTGAWATHAGQVALHMEGAWRFLIPRKGWRLWVEAENLFLIFDGATWISPAVPSTLQNLSLLGVNASADTASLLLQTGFSGRAEIGTAGDDNLHFKVSANGSTFNESLVIANATGEVTAKNSIILDPQTADPPTPSDGQLWYNSTTAKFRGRQNGTIVDVVSAGSGLADGDKGDITVSASGSLWMVDAAAITNNKLANMAALTFKANVTASSAPPQDLTADQTLVALNVHGAIQASTLIFA